MGFFSDRRKISPDDANIVSHTQHNLNNIFVVRNWLKKKTSGNKGKWGDVLSGEKL